MKVLLLFFLCNTVAGGCYDANPVKLCTGFAVSIVGGRCFKLAELFLVDKLTMPLMLFDIGGLTLNYG